eukprot:COSAG02_NODE_36962_length_448_cov_0.865330_1_plen_73_part_00
MAAAPALLLVQVLCGAVGARAGSSCQEELTPETNSTGMGLCVAACIDLAGVQPAKEEWRPGELGGEVRRVCS